MMSPGLVVSSLSATRRSRQVAPCVPRLLEGVERPLVALQVANNYVEHGLDVRRSRSWSDAALHVHRDIDKPPIRCENYPAF